MAHVCSCLSRRVDVVGGRALGGRAGRWGGFAFYFELFNLSSPSFRGTPHGKPPCSGELRLFSGVFRGMFAASSVPSFQSFQSRSTVPAWMKGAASASDPAPAIPAIADQGWAKCQRHALHRISFGFVGFPLKLNQPKGHIASECLFCFAGFQKWNQPPKLGFIFFAARVAGQLEVSWHAFFCETFSSSGCDSV